MKKILWTTFFWLIVATGFVFYVKMFNAPMANSIGTWLGATAIANQDTLSTGEETSVMSGIDAIQATLLDMQTTLDVLAGTEETTEVTPVVEEVTPE